jgi:hypothetical protein
MSLANTANGRDLTSTWRRLCASRGQGHRLDMRRRVLPVAARPFDNARPAKLSSVGVLRNVQHVSHPDADVRGLKVKFVDKVRDTIAQPLGRLSVAARVAVILLACLVVGGIVFWLFNELVYSYFARSYAEELADAYDLNRGFARALLWASFALLAPKSVRNKSRRRTYRSGLF